MVLSVKTRFSISSDFSVSVKANCLMKLLLFFRNTLSGWPSCLAMMIVLRSILQDCRISNKTGIFPVTHKKRLLSQTLQLASDNQQYSTIQLYNVKHLYRAQWSSWVESEARAVAGQSPGGQRTFRVVMPAPAPAGGPGEPDPSGEILPPPSANSSSVKRAHILKCFIQLSPENLMNTTPEIKMDWFPSLTPMSCWVLITM